MKNTNSSASNSAVASLSPAQVIEARAIAIAARTAAPADHNVGFYALMVLAPAHGWGALVATCSPQAFLADLRKLREAVAARLSRGRDADIYEHFGSRTVAS